ncbi:uncharacterized protein [Bemisia tabaci]|uniref:uncharacterized protein isoform X2 n=1 Tax=Bemisia tabaci TaxID=7038 RepID=UPI003B285456
MRGDRLNFEDTPLKSRSNATYRNKRITSLEQFVQQIPPSLLRKASSQKPALRQDEMNLDVRTENSRGDARGGNGTLFLQGLSSLKANLKNRSQLTEKPVSGSVLKCPLSSSGVLIVSEGNQKRKKDDTARLSYPKRRIHERKNAGEKITTSKSTSSMVKEMLPPCPLVTSGSQTGSVRSKSFSHSCHLPDPSDGSEIDAILARLLKEKEKRLLMENCVEGLKIGVSLNQQEVKSLIQSKKKAYTVAKLLKKKFEKAHTTNKEALKRVKALKIEKAELAEKLKSKEERLITLENEVSQLRTTGQISSMSSAVFKIREKNLLQVSRENEKLSKANIDQSKELSEERQKKKEAELRLAEAMREVKQLKAELEKKTDELEAARVEDNDRDTNSKILESAKDREAGLKRRINILTALESRQRTTVSELKGKLEEMQEVSSEMRAKFEGEIARLQEEINMHKDALKEERTEREKLKTLAAEYNKIIKCRNDRISELSKLIEDQEQTIETQRQQRGKEEHLTREVEEENTMLRERIDKELTPQLNDLQQTVEELRKAKELAETAVQESRTEKTVCPNCSSATQHTRFRNLLSSEDDDSTPNHMIGDHKSIYPQIDDFAAILNQRKQLHKDLESMKQEKNQFYCDLKELQRENNDMLRRINELSEELVNAREQAALLPHRESKLSHLEERLRNSEKEWREKWEKVKQEKEDAIETAKYV